LLRDNCPEPGRMRDRFAEGVKVHLSKSCRSYIVAMVIGWFVFSTHAALSQSTVPIGASGPDKPAMTMVQAMILGVVEGLTEYLPVSSTGHLLMAEKFMGIGETRSAPADARQRTKDAADAYTICIQAGAIIAVLGLYFGRVRQMLRGLLGKDEDGRRLLVNIAAGFIPAVVIGLPFNKTIKAHLFGPWPVVAAWFVGGLAILVVSWRNRRNHPSARSGFALEAMTWRVALCIGIAQCIAMWPGVSRSLVTIVGGVLAGLTLAAAVEYSFLLGVVTLGAATFYDGLKHGHLMLQTFDAAPIAIGLIFAFIAAVISVKWMVSYLNRHGLAVFGYYRVFIALVASFWLATNTMG
jgi:undecaprenyl-diphosphatase